MAEPGPEQGPRPDAMALLDRPWVFSQRSLLTPHDFESEARRRGLELNSHQGETDLERLARDRVLKPLYISRRPRRITQTMARQLGAASPRPVPMWPFAADGAGMRERRDAGLLRLGQRSRMQPQSSFWALLDGEPAQRIEHLYSPYQLLDLETIRSSLPVVRTRPARPSPWDGHLVERARSRAVHADERTVLLSALESIYYPRIRRSVSLSLPYGDFDAWTQLNRAFDPAELLAWLGWSADALFEEATGLLRDAHSCDPLAEWVDLVRHVAPDKWDGLLGGAKLAVDLRVAAEMILLFLEDLQPLGLALPFPDLPRFASHPIRGRIRAAQGSLDEVLTAFGLSPHPSVVLVLEGQTEMMTARRVMEELRVPSAESHIRLFDAGGENHDHSMLVKYAALPRLGAVEETGTARFIRPPARYLVMVDADGAYRQAAARGQLRAKLAGLLVASLPDEFDTPESRVEIERLVEVDTWAPALDFERAHFTDGQLARALLRSGCAPRGTTVESLASELAQVRREMQAGSKKGSMKRIVSRWGCQPSKPAVVDDLWPALRTRIRRCRTRASLDRIPVVRVVLAADELAARTPRRNVVMRVRARGA